MALQLLGIKIPTCSFDPVDLKKKTVCEAGWNKGFDSDEKK